MTAILTRRRLAVRPVRSTADAARALHHENVTAAFASEQDAAALLEQALDIPIIALVTSAEGDTARNLLRAGASAVLQSIGEEDVVSALERARTQATYGPASEERPPPPPEPARHGLLGNSQSMRQVLDLVSRVAPVLATAIIRGETGTGKELVARSLHQGSPRASGPFVKVHCAALPDNLLESELFGYEKGAFTGATTRKPGRVELAEGGTLFLDEIGEVTPATQVKLLRLLQDREYERLGGVQTLTADVRFVTATHRDLEAMVKKGEFREDLFYRLNVVTLWLPPLRARRDDIPLLAVEFVRQFGAAYGKPEVHLEGAAIAALRSERWSGNVRQLQNFVERLVVLSTRPAITSDDVQREMAAHTQFQTQLTGAARSKEADGHGAALSLEEAVKKAERCAVEVALRQAKGNRTVAARILGVCRATLYSKLEEYAIS